MRYYVIINGVNSLSIKGLAIKTLPSIIKPMMRTLREEIDGRNGDVITNLGYSAYDKQLEIGLYGEYDIDSIMAYFNQEGTIIFSDEDDKIYNFKILDQIDYAKLLKFRTAIVNLHIQPFKYPLEEEPIELIDSYVEGEGESLTLNETESAPLEIDLKGNTSQVVIPEETGTEVEGTSISVNDVVPTKEDYITLKGNTSQVQYSGKNIFNPSYATSNCSVSGNDITITTNSTDLYLAGGYLPTNPTLFEIPTGTYYALCTNPKAYITVYGIYDGETTVRGIPASGLTLSDTLYVKGIRIRSTDGTTSLNNEVVNLFLGKSTTYEPYVGSTPTSITPSPNPSYPQDIHSVSGDNNVVVEGKNLCNGITQNYYLNQATQSIGKINGNSGLFIEVNGGDYTISTTAVQERMRAGVCNELPALNATVACYRGQNKDNTSNSITIDTTGYKYLVINVTDLTKVQIEKGSTATTYEPYTGNTYPLYLPVENLFDKDNANILNNTYIGSSSLGTSTGASTLYISCKPNATYTISRLAGKRFVLGDTSTTPTSGVSISNRVENHTATNLTITTSQNAQYLCVFYYLSSQDTLTEQEIRDSIQIEYGSKANHYTPYGTTPIELNKIGNYQDKIVKTDKWYWYREIGEVVFNGSEDNWTWQSGGVRTYIKINDSINTNYNNASFYCTHFTPKTSDFESGNVVQYGQIYYFYISNLVSSLNDWKTWLSTHNTKVNYVLATPTYTEITDTTLLQQLNDLYNATIYGTTNISSMPNDLEPFIDIKYNVVTPSPSPERPSIINVVSGTNTIKVANDDDSESQTLQIRLGSIKLRYVDEAQDYIYKSGDKWYTHALTGEKTFVGNSAEGWAMTSTPRGLKEFTAQISDMKKNSSIYCDNFTQVPETTQMAYETYTPSIATTNSKSIFIMLGDGSIASGSDFRTWLSTNNTTVVYPLNTAVDTEITDTDLLEDLEALLEATSYNPETVITQTNNDKPFIIYAKALKQGSGEAIVENEGNIYAKPTFEIEGTGLVQVLIDNNQVLEVDTTNDTIVIDTENMEATNKTDGTLANRQVVGDYSKIKLNVGNNDVKLTGNYTKGTITKYTRYL